MAAAAIGEIQFEQNIGDVALDRVLADRQPPGDGRIAQAIGYKHNDFTLARTQKIEVRRGTPRSGLLRRVRLRTVMVADSEEAQPGFESLDRFSPVLGEVEPGARNEIGNNARGEYLAGLRPRADALRAINRKPGDAGVAELDLAGVYAAGDAKVEPARCVG
jgi:hypothetical protein